MQGYLRDPAPGLTVEELLRHALRDPSVRVAFWVDDRRQWVCADGRPAPAPSAHPGVDRIDAHHHDRPVARVCFDPDRVDRQLVQEAVAEAIGELDNVGLRAAVALQLVEAQQSRARIAAAQQQERRRIERNLHDGAQQRLLALALQLQAAQVNGDPARLRDTVGTSIAQLQTAMTELRELANGLHPAVLSDGGLAAVTNARTSAESRARPAADEGEKVRAIPGASPQACPAVSAATAASLCSLRQGGPAAIPSARIATAMSPASRDIACLRGSPTPRCPNNAAASSSASR